MGATVSQGQRIRAREGEEIWESTVAGQVWVETTDDRGRSKSIPVRGYGRLRISPLDRELCQEQVVDPANDPFINGMLIRLDADQGEDPKTASEFALTTEQVAEIFALTGEGFKDRVDALNEVTIRRMIEMADAVDATTGQVSYLKETVETRFAIGGDTPTYREMMAESRPRG